MAYLVHPWLLVAGLVAVSLPVLIHLLNRRRFVVVDWAAMDFLLEADKQSRRRIRLQHWLLLALRSLAVALVGLLLARPSLPTGLSTGLLSAGSVERIIVLDDSLSMQARDGNESAWDAAKHSAMELVRRFASQNAGSDPCTLLVASQIERPVMLASAMTTATIDEWQSRLNELRCSDRAVRLSATLESLAQSIRSQAQGRNRSIYVFTDMRQPDWLASETTTRPTAATSGPFQSLRALSEQAESCLLIDVGHPRDANLTVAKVQADGPVVSDVRTALDVTMLNQGSATADRIDIKLHVDDGLPAVQRVERLSPGESRTLRFHPTFLCESTTATGGTEEDRDQAARVRVVVQSENIAADILTADSTFYFPPRVRCGIRTLLIDGDPSAELGKSESFYLRRALVPAGPAHSGIQVTLASGAEVDALSFADFDAIFVLNCHQLGTKVSENVHRLANWVASGGALVVMLGDQTEVQAFNDQFWRDGQGLSPVRLTGPATSYGETDWAGLRLAEDNHLLPRLTAEQESLLENVKIFRYWPAAAAENPLKAGASVVARFTDRDGSSAIVEQPAGKGHVVVFTIPADADWHNWPSHPSYVLMMQDLVHALVRDETNEHLLHAGEPIRQSIDVAQFQLEATVEDPEGNKALLHASPEGRGKSDSTSWQVVQPAVERLGFYQLALTRREGGHDSSLFAVNADITEGNLRRADIAATRSQLSSLRIGLIPADDLESLTDSGGKTELWRYFAFLLLAVLASEQLLGWFFGRERT